MTNSYSAVLDERLLKRMYIELGKTDKEIASFFNIDRTTVVHARKEYGIKTRLTTGRVGELSAIQKIRELGNELEDMKENNKLSDFDLLVNYQIKVEVIAANMHDGRYRFSLSEQEQNGMAISETRIKLNNGRTKKLFNKTCDFIVFVGIDKRGNSNFWVIPSSDIPLKLQTLTISPTGKYSKYSNRWDYFRE
ncbi:hypothetical protein [Oceanobacillus sp. FSL H7-0719]|uniref:hypothetical protein n=1 Tax=Oceanobacillus sp. FSL H7-0719 TaxID=2954507 RepID=UPI0032462838